MVEMLCALVGCLVLPYLLATFIFVGETARDLSRPSDAPARPRRRSPGLFAALALRHRRAMYVVRESERLRERERDEG